MSKRRTRRKQRKSKSSRRRRRRGGDGGSCSGPGRCQSDKAQTRKNLCLSYEYNPNARNDSNCKWTPKSQALFKRVRNIKGKERSVAGLAKYGLDTDGNKIPTVEEPTVEESHDSPCEDDDSYVSPTNKAGIPLCKMIRSRKAKLKAATDKDTRKEMKAILNDIQTGKFVRDWMLECKVKQPNFKASRRISKDHQIEVVGKKLRDMMPWIQKNKLVDTSKN